MVIRSLVLMVFSLWLTGMAQAAEHESLTFEAFFTEHSSPMWMIDVDTGLMINANPASKAF